MKQNIIECTGDCKMCIKECIERREPCDIEAIEKIATIPASRTRDEIDEWLEKECNIRPGCSSINSLVYSTAREVAEKAMEYAKQEMVKDAIEGMITFDYYNYDKTYGCIAHDSFCLEDFGLKDRDEVKVIVIKEG